MAEGCSAALGHRIGPWGRPAGGAPGAAPRPSPAPASLVGHALQRHVEAVLVVQAVPADGPGLAVGAHQELDVAHVAGEAHVLEGEHVAHQPVLPQHVAVAVAVPVRRRLLPHGGQQQLREAPRHRPAARGRPPPRRAPPASPGTSRRAKVAAPGSSTREPQRWHSTAFRFRPCAHTNPADPGEAATGAGGEEGGAAAGSISAQAAAMAAQPHSEPPQPGGRSEVCLRRVRSAERAGRGGPGLALRLLLGPARPFAPRCAFSPTPKRLGKAGGAVEPRRVHAAPGGLSANPRCGDVMEGPGYEQKVNPFWLRKYFILYVFNKK